MEALEISFSDALARLQPLLGRNVCALVNVRGTFSGCTLEGGLKRVVTLPPDQQAVHIIIGDGQGIVLDPDDVDVLLVRDAGGAHAALLFHLPNGTTIQVEAA